MVRRAERILSFPLRAGPSAGVFVFVGRGKGKRHPLKQIRTTQDVDMVVGSTMFFFAPGYVWGGLCDMLKSQGRWLYYTRMCERVDLASMQGVNIMQM